MADDARKPDAIEVGRTAGGSPVERLRTLQQRFGPVLGGTIYVRNQGTHYFITTDPADTILYPSDHPLAKQERYTWEDRDGGVRYGYLKKDPAPDAPNQNV